LRARKPTPSLRARSAKQSTKAIIKLSGLPRRTKVLLAMTEWRNLSKIKTRAPR
jgi:hypothetical protein